MYIGLLVLVICTLGSLPLVQVPISVRVPGIIRPVTERHEIRSPLSGFIERLGGADNQRVEANEELVFLRAGTGEIAHERLSRRLGEVNVEISALELLVSAESPISDPPLASSRWRREFESHRVRTSAVGLELTYARSELERTSRMVSGGLAPAIDLREREIRVQRLLNDSLEIVATSVSRWAAELERSRNERDVLDSEMRAGEVETAQAVLHAPVAGTLDEITPISIGSYVTAGTPLFTLSPDGETVAEAYVPAREIALLQINGKARIMVDSFDYSVWGFLTGTLRSISPDHVVVNDRPVFVVEIALDRATLTTRSGVVGSARPGMTLQAHFEVARRSLWQLLRDDLDDWLNPARDEGARLPPQRS